VIGRARRRLGGIFEHSPCCRAPDARPFATIDALHAAMMRAVREARTRSTPCPRSPELAASGGAELTASTWEQWAPVTSARESCAADRAQRRVQREIRVPFTSRSRATTGTLREFARRVENDRATEVEEASAQVARIARFRKLIIVTSPSSLSPPPIVA
jgi:2-oxo-4-hydroxy-4-carboxy--5-ureidoimidazoline (OHCU) decarboxylase